MSDINNPGPPGANSPIISGTQSRFLTLPPRVEIRIQDDRTGSYPVIRRTGDHDRMGFMSSTFNDMNTPIFGESKGATGTGNILYPHMLPVGSQLIQGLTGTIVSFGSSSAGNAFINTLVSQTIMPGGRAPESLTPFDDSRIYLSQSAFYLTGTAGDIHLGFSSPLKDKTQIQFDITHNSAQMAYLTRFTRHAVGAGPATSAKNDKIVSASSEFKDHDLTGMLYYNFNLRRWEMIGNVDPASQANTVYDFGVASSGSSAGDISSGTSFYPRQFTPCGNYLTVSESVRMQQNYPVIGYPTVTNQAPFDTKYHATSSQCLRLSDYISSPFLLEKIVVDLPVMAQRQTEGTGTVSGNALKYGIDAAAQNEQQDYMFFMYRQQRQPFAGGKYSGHNDIGHSSHASGSQGSEVTASLRGRDTPYDVSGSNRFLICSASMCFYNNQIYRAKPDGGPSKGVYDYTPLNGPAFKHAFNMDPRAGPYDASDGEAYVPLKHSQFLLSGTFTGSIKLEIQPAVAAPRFTGRGRVPVSTDGYGVGENHYNAFVRHFWPGGTTCEPFAVKNASGSWRMGRYFKASTKFTDDTFGVYSKSSEMNRVFPAFTGSDIYKVDPRPVKKFGGLAGSRFLFDVTAGIGGQLPLFRPNITGTVSIKSPYLLMPSDELILGLDACVGLNEWQQGYTLTGTRAGICTPQLHSKVSSVNGGRAKITLFGSLIKEGKEYHETLNQNLTSPNIHEAIIGAPVVDQYDINTKEEMIGTYVDNYVVGSMFATGTTNGTKGDRADGGKLPREQLNFIRTVMGSFASGTAVPRSGNGMRSYYGSGSIQRFVRASSRVERFYDTFLPDVYEYLVTYLAAGTPRIGNAYTMGFDGMVGNLLLATGSVVLQVNGNRMKLPFDNNLKRYPESWGETFNSATPLSDDSISPAGTPTAGRLQGIFLAKEASSPGNVNGLFINDRVAKRILFETGKGSLLTDFNDGQSVFPTTDSDSGISGSARGFMYGIQSTEPLFSSAAYRWNRYGQFRDMLEQRQDGKFFATPIASTEEDAVESTPGLKSGVVIAKFVKPSSTSSVDPGQTQCSNLSFECTSSVPYYDGLFRNRDIEVDREEELLAII